MSEEGKMGRPFDRYDVTKSTWSSEYEKRIEEELKKGLPYDFNLRIPMVYNDGAPSTSRIPKNYDFAGDAGKVISTAFAENHLKYLQHTPVFHLHDYEADINIDVHYDLQLPDAYFPAGSLTIQIPSPNLDTSDTAFKYVVSANDDVFEQKTGTVAKDGYIAITNKNRVNSKISGNIKVRFKIPLRNCKCDNVGHIEYKGMKAVLIITATSYKETYTADDLSFMLIKFQDTIGITAGLMPVYEMPDGLRRTNYNGNHDDYYWVSLHLTSYCIPYTRKCTGINISAIFADTGTIIQMTTDHHLGTPPPQKIDTLWKTGETPPTGCTITKNTFNYTSNDDLEIGVILTVMYKISDFEGTTIRVNGEWKYLLEGAAGYKYPPIAKVFPIEEPVDLLCTKIPALSKTR